MLIRAGSTPFTRTNNTGSLQAPFVVDTSSLGSEPLAVASQQQAFARYNSILFYHPIMRANVGSDPNHTHRRGGMLSHTAFLPQIDLFLIQSDDPQQDLNRFVHSLNGNMLIRTVEGIASCAEIGAGQSLKG